MPQLAEQLATAITTARTTATLDNTARLIWRALSEALIDDADAERLSIATEARRAALEGGGRRNMPRTTEARPRPCRTPERTRSIARRRSLATSGAVPSSIALHFTISELAALTVIAREIQRSGRCTLFKDQIASMAGTSRTVVHDACRKARELGLITITERRFSAWRNDANLITITAPEWRKWLGLDGRGGGFGKVKSTNTRFQTPSFLPVGNGLQSGNLPFSRTPDVRICLRATAHVKKGQSGPKT